MAMKKLKNKNVRKLTRVGGTSLAVTIPREMLSKLKWKERQRVTVKLEGRKIIIKDWR